MKGLSVVLEASQKDISKKAPQVLSKASMNMIKPPSSSSSSPFSKRDSSNLSSFQGTAGFLDRCFLCNQKLLPGRDIYMYKGDRAFCSEECRYRQILMDEEENMTVKAKKDNCSTSSSSSHCRKGARNRANGFAC